MAFRQARLFTLPEATKALPGYHIRNPKFRIS